MGSRRKARESTLQRLYQRDLAQDSSVDAPDLYWSESEMDEETRRFADRLYTGVCEHWEVLGELVETHSAHWRTSRMAAVDKNILRMAVYELKFCPDIPVKVTINEAVEIAKRFGTAESGAFVNGILDHIAKAVRPTMGEEGEG